jgi:hypothetical protein
MYIGFSAIALYEGWLSLRKALANITRRWRSFTRSSALALKRLRFAGGCTALEAPCARLPSLKVLLLKVSMDLCTSGISKLYLLLYLLHWPFGEANQKHCRKYSNFGS